MTGHITTCIGEIIIIVYIKRNSILYTKLHQNNFFGVYMWLSLVLQWSKTKNFETQEHQTKVNNLLLIWL